jgi:hypothetical protein
MIAPSARMMSLVPLYAGERLRKLRFLMTDNSAPTVERKERPQPDSRMPIKTIEYVEGDLAARVPGSLATITDLGGRGARGRLQRSNFIASVCTPAAAPCSTCETDQSAFWGRVSETEFSHRYPGGDSQAEARQLGGATAVLRVGRSVYESKVRLSRRRETQCRRAPKRPERKELPRLAVCERIANITV